ncbi:S41 family peptidase [Oryzifoliimicrobium ureilyticus]|uniref:S41 family peptidase n=1 Tax=Oryzifoliimicrobium ureilyticus TaxID=3113724 RepID=UPI0030767392
MIRRASLLVLGALIGAMVMAAMRSSLVPAIAANDSSYKELAVFSDVLDRVRRQYVTKPDDDKLVEAAINGMLTSLDPHSSYMNAKDADDMRSDMKGEFGGLGIQVTMDNDLVKVIAPIDGTPAAKAGVLSGDYITEIDGQSVQGMKLQDAVEKLRGPVNTPIKLTLVRAGVDDPIKLTILRDIISVDAVKSRVEGDVGYLRIISFTEKTYPDFEKAIQTIKNTVPADKLKGYVIDLRLNPGGLLNQAVEVADAVLDHGEIVSVRGRNADETRRFEAAPGDLTDHKPIIVLINGGSASASEIVAGALQDLHRATILGTRSFGKGSVQTIIPLGDDNGQLRLTTALYYTPSGRSIQGTGITPDIKLEEPLPDDMKGKVESSGESALRGHIKGQSETDEGSGSISYVPPDPKDDVQLHEALDLLRGQKTDKAFPPTPSSAASSQ